MSDKTNPMKFHIEYEKVYNQIQTPIRPFKCPICNGKGIVPAGFYTSITYNWISANTSEKCRTCNGQGIIWG